MKIYRLDSLLFQYVIYISLLESVINFISSILITNTTVVPRWINVLFATLFFVLQSTKIYALVRFSFAYMNPHITSHSPGFWVITVTYLINLFLSVSTPFTHFYFYFDEAGHYVQGYGSNIGYYFYLLNVVFCLVYVLKHRNRLLYKDISVAGWIALFVIGGVIIQFYFRSVLMIGISMALSVLYLYMTLENPNDYQDKLTLCANEYGFKIYIDHKCEQKKIFTVLFFDLHKFRYVNSIYGMEMGDFLLQKFAQMLEDVFHKQVVFRIHNDLFAVVVNAPQDSVKGYVRIVLERVQHEWKMPNGKTTKLDAVAVLCQYPNYFESHTELVRLRNYMIRKVKESHEERVLYCEREIADRCKREEAIEKAVKHAIDAHTLKVYYQPIVDSKTGRVEVLEALARIKDEKLGEISPVDFIDVAENTGQIIGLGFYVFESVCRFIRDHLLKNPKNTVSHVQINLSSLQCAYPPLKDRFIEIMEVYEIPPSMIYLELTESTMVETPELVKQTMKELIQYGIHFSLDDYGTGYSNIFYLIQFPFEQIKFDKHMVWSYFESREANIIVKNEFEVLHTLQKDIVAEGIETEEQYEQMKSQGIRLLQGYYFSKALPVEELMEYLNKKEL